MALPKTIDPATPVGTEGLGLGDDQIRALKLAITDILGIPVDPTAIAAAAFTIIAAGLKSVNFQDAAANPATAGFLQRNDTALKFHDGMAVRTVILDTTNVVIAAIVAQLREASGPTNLTLAGIADGQYFRRSGATVVGADLVAIPPGMPESFGLTGTNNTGTPNMIFDFSATWVSLLNHSTGGVQGLGPTGTLSCNVGTAGPIANGRDQVGAFSASSWIHFHFIIKADGTGLATLASTSETAPTLPATYTHFAYMASVRFNGSSNLVGTLIRGNRAYYHSNQAALANGSATTETAVSLAAFIPPTATAAILQIAHTNDNAASDGSVSVKLRVITGADFTLANKSSRIDHYYELQIPNVSQQFYYLWSGAPVALGGLDVNVAGYILSGAV